MRKAPLLFRPIAVVALVAAGALAWFAWPIVRIVGQVAFVYPDYSHCALVPFLACFLAWTRREELRKLTGGSPWMGVPLAGAGSILSLLGSWYEIALQPGSLGYVFLLGVGVVLVIGGGLWSFLGTNRFRAVLGPLAFLLFAVPLPESVIASLTAPLRTIAVIGATFLLRLGGLAAHREGNIIELANGSVGVDDACSGIRSIWVLLAFAAFIYAVMRMSGVRALLLLLAVPVMAIAANLVRIGLSAWAVVRGHAGLAAGPVHDLLGLVTVAAASAGIVGLGLLLGRSRGGRGASQAGGSGCAPDPFAASRRHSYWIAPLAVCALLVLGSLARRHIEDHYRQFHRREVISVVRRDLAELPEAMGHRRPVTVLDLAPHEIAALKPDDRLVVSCADPSGVTIYLRVLYWKPELVRPSSPPYGRSPHSPDACYPAVGWISDSQFEHEREFPWANGEQVGVRIFRKLDRELLMFFWQDLGPTDARLFVPAEMKDRMKALIRSWTVPPSAYRPAQYEVVIAGETSGDARKTREVLVAFCRDVAPLLPAYGIGKGVGDKRTE